MSEGVCVCVCYKDSLNLTSISNGWCATWETCWAQYGVSFYETNYLKMSGLSEPARFIQMDGSINSQKIYYIIQLNIFDKWMDPSI